MWKPTGVGRARCLRESRGSPKAGGTEDFSHTKQMEVAINTKGELKALASTQRQQSKSKAITGNSYVLLPTA